MQFDSCKLTPLFDGKNKKRLQSVGDDWFFECFVGLLIAFVNQAKSSSLRHKRQVVNTPKSLKRLVIFLHKKLDLQEEKQQQQQL